MDAGKIIKALIKAKFSGKKKSSSGLGSLLNSNTLLLGLGAAGVAGAAYLAHKHMAQQQPGAGPTPTPPVPPGPLPPPSSTNMAPVGGYAAVPPPLPPPLPAPTNRNPAVPPPLPMPPAAAVVVPPAAPAPAAEDASADSRGLFLIRAMIAAAHADHEIDEEERRRILGKAEVFALDADERGVLEQELTRPLSVFEVVDATRRQGHPARAVYAASFLAISADTAAERAYLRRLADGLGLSVQEVQEVEALAEE